MGILVWNKMALKKYIIKLSSDIEMKMVGEKMGSIVLQ